MAKVTSKYQVTVPKVIAEQYGIRPGDEIGWAAAGDVIRVVPSGLAASSRDTEARVRSFDQATERHRRRRSLSSAKPRGRGWKREDLYTRGSTR
ncbi:MAG: AbrB/MazE/SpoVT family DNA-binding domain-containing protein [Bryobacterales bacterium]|nr:AbrB/MazE/SpoVT family DNA-binding domain-containing protein [Bryobacterales bacterium]